MLTTVLYGSAVLAHHSAAGCSAPTTSRRPTTPRIWPSSASARSSGARRPTPLRRCPAWSWASPLKGKDINPRRGWTSQPTSFSYLAAPTGGTQSAQSAQIW